MGSSRTLTIILLCVSCTIADEFTYSQVKRPVFRTSKALFRKKIGDGAAFLSGVKLGSYLANKGLYSGLGQGSLSTAHTFQLFGKTFNSALTLAYGDGPIAAADVPVLNDAVEMQRNSSDMSKTNATVHHVLLALLDNPSPQTLQKLNNLAKGIEEDTEAEEDRKFTAKKEKKANFKEDKCEETEKIDEHSKSPLKMLSMEQGDNEILLNAINNGQEESTETPLRNNDRIL